MMGDDTSSDVDSFSTKVKISLLILTRTLPFLGTAQRMQGGSKKSTPWDRCESC